MAKLRLTQLFPESTFFVTGNLYNTPLTRLNGDRDSVLYATQDQAANEILLKGSGFRYQDGELIKGTITSITFQNSDGDDYMVVSGLKLHASKLPSIASDQFDELLYNKAMAGDDTLIGTNLSQWLRGGNGDDTLVGQGGHLDVLIGGEGNDRYTGGKGCDYFATGPGQGRDVVTDFKATKSDPSDWSSQDYFTSTPGSTFGEWDVRKRGNDTIIDFGHGDMLILLDVKARDIDMSDFNI